MKVKRLGSYTKSNFNQTQVIDPLGLSLTVCGNHNQVQSILIKNNTKKGYLEAMEGDGLDLETRRRRRRGRVQKGMAQTINTQNNKGVVVKENLKEKLCNKLIENNMVEEGDVIRHSYTRNRLDNGEKNMGRIESTKKLSPTLDTRCDCLGVVVNNESVYTETEKQLFTEDGNIKRYIDSDIIDKFEEGQMATTSYPNGYGHASRTHNESIALNTIDKPSVKQNLRIRKLTEKECFRLMGVKNTDYDKLSAVKTKKYQQAGNSIVVQVLMGIFGKLCGMSDKDIDKKIKESVEEIRE